MSLINDALKRAQQAQQENPPGTPPLEFRPVEPSQNENRRPTLIFVGLALVVVMILGLGAALVWFVSQSNSGGLRVAARGADAPVVSLPIPPPAAVAPPVPVAVAVSNLPVAVLDTVEAAPTNAAPAVAAIVAVVPPALRLQGIFFNPRNPSAVLNGRTLYLGDRVDGFRVMAVSPVSVTLVSATATNVLSLSE